MPQGIALLLPTRPTPRELGLTCPRMHHLQSSHSIPSNISMHDHVAKFIGVQIHAGHVEKARTGVGQVTRRPQAGTLLVPQPTTCISDLTPP